eukprot:406245-Pelagomonas_calceolata.AAC.1
MNRAKRGASLRCKTVHAFPLSQRSFGKKANRSICVQDELLSVLFIWRIVVAVIAAVACGTLPATGWMPPAVFFLASILSTVMFYKGYLQIDEVSLGCCSKNMHKALYHGLSDMPSSRVFNAQKIFQDEFGGKSQLLADGSPLSMCAFMVSWLLAHGVPVGQKVLKGNDMTRRCAFPGPS